MKEAMKVLAIEPYYSGSHRAFLDGWSRHSQWQWTIFGLPGHHWKWRMRHAPLTMAEQVSRAVAEGQAWDAIVCSDMLNLAEFRGLVSPPVAQLPAVAYFHENQLTYPVRSSDERDHHFTFSNLMTADSADEVWFNSEFHRTSFSVALRSFLKRMPDFQPLDRVDRLLARSRIMPPGIAQPPALRQREPGPLRLLWAARWEHDKNPETFFSALELLEPRPVAWRLSVIGQSFREVPEIFADAKQRWGERIDRWGFQSARDYATALREADVYVSTANHEFFGIAAVEAMAAGNYPLLPRRLAYPELLGLEDYSEMVPFFYDGTAHQLADRLQEAASLVQETALWETRLRLVHRAVSRFSWSRLVQKMDQTLLEVAARDRSLHTANAIHPHRSDNASQRA